MGVRYLRRPPRPPARRLAAGGARYSSDAQGRDRLPAASAPTLATEDDSLAVTHAQDGVAPIPCEHAGEGRDDGDVEEAQVTTVQALGGAP